MHTNMGSLIVTLYKPQSHNQRISSKIIFYVLAFQEHIWVPFSEAPPVCSERCAAEYILGIEDKKK